MSANPDYVLPRFQVGDRVTITLIGPYRGKEGVVTEIVEHHGDHVYRYRVRFDDGTAAAFFGFELKLSKIRCSGGGI